MAEQTTHEFENVTIYRTGMFGVGALACKTVKVTTGVKYAQYENAIRVEYLEKGKRTRRAFILDYKPWLRVVDSKVAIAPDEAIVKQENGSSVSRYTSFDPRYMTDFEDGLVAKGVPVLLSIGEGDREKCMRCTDRIATTIEGGSHVCGLCASAIRQESGFISDEAWSQ